MRQSRMLLVFAGMLALGVLGCKTVPELKPDEQPDVLSYPTEKRYQQDAKFPASVLTNDPIKQMKMENAAKNRPPGMGNMGGPQGGSGY